MEKHNAGFKQLIEPEDEEEGLILGRKWANQSKSAVSRKQIQIWPLKDPKNPGCEVKVLGKNAINFGVTSDDEKLLEHGESQIIPNDGYLTLQIDGDKFRVQSTTDREGVNLLEHGNTAESQSEEKEIESEIGETESHPNELELENRVKAALPQLQKQLEPVLTKFLTEFFIQNPI